MLAYIKTLINIVFRKLGPEDLPDSGFLLGFTFAVYIFLQGALTWILEGPPLNSAKMLAFSVAMLTFCLWALLRLAGFPSRFRQTLTALLGTGALLTVISAPFSFWRQLANAESEAAFPMTAEFALVIWLVFIEGHILSRALSKPFGVGLVAAVIYFVLYILVRSQLLQAGVLG